MAAVYFAESGERTSGLHQLADELFFLFLIVYFIQFPLEECTLSPLAALNDT